MDLKKFVASALICCVSLSSGLTAAVGAEAGSPVFADVNDHWSKAETEYLAGKGIIDGVELDGKRWILPDRTVTRAEFVKMLVGATGKKAAGSSTAAFKDVPVGHWAQPYIETAKKEGWVDGYDNGSFQPDAQITRAELATMLVRGYQLKEQTGNTVSFADVPADYWAYASIRTAASNKLIEGSMENGQTVFKPVKSATRAESIAVIARYLKAQEGTNPPVTPTQPTDNPSTTTPTEAAAGAGASSGGSKHNNKANTVSLNGQQLIDTVGNGNPISGTDAQNNTVALAGLNLSGYYGSLSDIHVEMQKQETLTGSSTTVVPGLTGPVIEFNTNGNTFSNATLTLNVGSIATQQNLTAAYYNETTKKFEFLSTAYNVADGTVSFSTTHNSKYVLIDKTAWDQAWRNSLTVTSGVYKPYVDFAFIIDSSGSMMDTDPQNLRKKAVTDLVYGLNFNPNSEQVLEIRDISVANAVYHYEGSVYKEADRAAVIDFDNSARAVVTFSTYGPTVAAAVYYGIDSSGGTNIFAGLKLAYGQFESAGDANHRYIAVLLTDGEDTSGLAPDWNAITAAYGKGVTLITMGLGDSVNSGYLTQMATLGGGQYFHVRTSEQLEAAFRTVVDTTRHDEFVDADGDGIDDYYEVTGMLLENGMLVKTSIDPNNGKDTDQDGFTDGEEMGQPVDVVITEDMVPQGSDLVGKTVKMFKAMKSMPTDPRTRHKGKELPKGGQKAQT
ncbi:S-layer homology domain-containing protein [Paenibacillus rigui]|uniref:VWFA domain-containing protein n=1 Tax=Paenibacillus rigui TaxID=554312 RepID=A0A229UWU7_9BACL|nr:S-layer homology domain-containing protein [Paenibacillus rigui]OXM87850.1 hypothetical protein CF651_01695 [Paenibacillus rigui]